METKQVTVTAEDGTPVTLVIPTTTPTQERAEVLRELFAQYVVAEGDNWKGPCYAIVNKEAAADVAEAMEFMGAPVDTKKPMGGGLVRLWTRGYYHHVGA